MNHAATIIAIFSLITISDAVQVNGEEIHAAAIAEALEYSDNIELLHFSACSIMAGDAAKEIKTTLAKNGVSFPISGYPKLVPWGLSAGAEFSYFGMILEHRMQPAEAARQLKLLMPHVGAKAIEGSAFPPMDFRFQPGGK